MTFDFSWLADFLKSCIDYFYDKLIQLINLLILSIGTALDLVLSLFPSGSNLSLSVPSFEYFGVVNWFLPVSGILVSLAIYTAALLSYLVVAPFARWLKLMR